VVGLSVAASALVARQALLAFQAWRVAPRAAKRFYEGGFETEMSREEALKILGLRERHASESKRVMEAYRDVIKGVHADQGGSNYLATKVNEVRQPEGGGWVAPRCEAPR
jgi:DnaJ family protein C protein 19